jgi:DNA repair protein RadD
MPLRDYQQAAVDAATNHIRKHQGVVTGVIDAATGSGKSHIIAELARWLNHKVGKKVLCLAPSKELVQQNHKKYLATGNPASIYSASINKSLAHDVVFGSPLTVKNNISKFGDLFSLIIIDECHGITPTIINIIDEIRSRNHRLRVIGLTATPYRMNMGYIYSMDESNRMLDDKETIDPYFTKLIFKIGAHELIERGFLTPPQSEHTPIRYDTSNIVNDTEKEYKAAFNDKGRLTADIVRDVVDRSYDRKGVMFFAATIQHANEIYGYLNPDMARIVTGSTPKKEREKIINDYIEQKYKYLVNVAVLTTGFDAPHVDVVAILRATESVALFQQIVGRGLRLYPGKKDCLVLDYAQNIERHCPNGDIFDPTIKAKKPSSGERGSFSCPSCSGVNEFAFRDNPDGYGVDDSGYFIDLKGVQAKSDDGIPIPAHHGRRCQNNTLDGGELHRCTYKWSFKICDECDHENDIAARYCESCKVEIVDPNDKLVMEFTRIKKDPYAESTDEVRSWTVKEYYTRAGDQTLRITYTTDYRTFTVFYRSDKSFLWRSFESLCVACFGSSCDSVDEFLTRMNDLQADMPKTITCHKNKNTGFFSVTDHNRPADEIPS